MALLAAAALVAGCGGSSGSDTSVEPAPPCDIAAELDEGQCAAVRALALPEALPPARGNAVGDDPAAAHLGFAMFYDSRFSSNQSVRCATCHPPERKFQDAVPLGKGLGPLTRNTPALLNVARLSTFFWDGRADSLWSQALGPLESPVEMGFSRLGIAHRVAKSYAAAYEGVFGPLPPLDDAARFPPDGAPGDPAFDSMQEADREAVNRIAANVGKALDAYQRKLAAGPAPLDRFLAGDETALTAAERRGLVVFAQAGCADCHSGPMLTDEGFHDLGLPTLAGATPDAGRAKGIAALDANEFNAQGAYWDGARPDPPAAATDADIGAFRTPSLRNVALSAPYGHDGRFATLADVVDFHLKGGGRGDPNVVGTVDALLQPHTLSSAQKADLVTFLESLNGDYPLPPWNNWPDK